MKTRQERGADMSEKVGVVFLAAAFLQAENPGQSVLFFALAIGSLYISLRLSGASGEPKS